MTTRTCVAQYATAQKAKEKKKAYNPKLLSPFFWRAQARLEVSGDFWKFFFCRLTPTQHARSLSEAARPPACIVAGSFGARQGGLQGRPSTQHVPASLFGNRRAGPALIRGRTEPSTADRHDTPTLSLTVTLSPPAVSFYISFFFFPHALPSSLQGSEITL